MASTEKILQLGEKQKEKAVLRYSKSSKPEVRAAAATAMGMIKKSDDCFNQLTILLRDSDNSVKEAAVKAIGSMGRKNASEYIRYQMDHSNDEAFVELCKHTLGNLSAGGR